MSDELKHSVFKSTDCISEQTMFDYIDNKLAAKERHLVEKHLLDCELCADAMEGLELVKDRNKIALVNQEIDKRIIPIVKTEAKVVSINYKMITGIAASLLLLIGGVFFFKQYADKGMQEKDVAVLTQTPPPAVAEIPKEEEQKPEGKDATLKEEKKREIDLPSTKVSKLEADKKPDNVPVAATGSTVTLTETTADKTTAKAIDETKEMEQTEIKAGDTYNWTTSNANTTPQSKNQEITIDTKNTDSVTDKRTFKYKEQANGKKEDLAKAAERKVNTTAYAPPVSAVAKNNSIAYEEPTIPQFPGGDGELFKFITKNFKYTATDGKRNEADGTKIIVGFTVDSIGNIINPKIVKGINTELNNEALRVVSSMPKWIPAKQKGKPVSMPFNLPIQLEIKNADEK
jgi:TonB family protein